MIPPPFSLNPSDSNLVALAVDFYISNIGDLTPDQYTKLESLLMLFDDYLDAHEDKVVEKQHEKILETQGNLIRVDFGENLD
jgi:hypothetical protein